MDYFTTRLLTFMNTTISSWINGIHLRVLSDFDSLNRIQMYYIIINREQGLDDYRLHNSASPFVVLNVCIILFQLVKPFRCLCNITFQLDKLYKFLFTTLFSNCFAVIIYAYYHFRFRPYIINLYCL